MGFCLHIIYYQHGKPESLDLGAPCCPSPCPLAHVSLVKFRHFLKRKLTQKVHPSSTCLHPKPPTDRFGTFGGMSGYLIMTGTHCHFWLDRQSDPLPPPPLWDTPQVPEDCWTIHKAQSGSRMHNRKPDVKPETFTAGFPWLRCQRLHPKPMEQSAQVGTSLDI